MKKSDYVASEFEIEEIISNLAEKFHAVDYEVSDPDDQGDRVIVYILQSDEKYRCHLDRSGNLIEDE